MPKIPAAEEDEAAQLRAAQEARLRSMNSLQWLAMQAEHAFEAGLDLALGPPTESALRPAGALRENSERQGHARELKTRRKKRRAPVRLNDGNDEEAAAAPTHTKSGRRIPTDFERQAAAKRRALQILELQREEEEWQQAVKDTAATNAKNIAQSTLVQVGGLYAVSQACLLSIFVPQKCPAITACPADGCLSSPWFDYPADQPDGHLCSLKENVDWFNFTQRNKNVFLFNICTLIVMLAAQAYFWKREVWMINTLEEDNNVPYNNLQSELDGYPEYQEAVEVYNRGCFYFALSVAILIVVNFGMSTDFLINGDEVYNYNLGTRTVTGLLTNTMLVSTKVIGYLSYARLSYANNWSISMFTVVPLSYNRLDDSKKRRVVKTVADFPIDYGLDVGSGASSDKGAR